MSDTVEAFEEQFDSDAELKDLKEEFVGLHVESLQEQEEDPFQATLEAMLDIWDFDVAPTVKVLQCWSVELQEEIEWQLNNARARAESEAAVLEFYRLRGEGRTVLSASRTLKKAPSEMMALVRLKTRHADSQEVRELREAQLEEHRMKAYRARQRVYNALGSKVQKELADRDFSEVPTEKLAQLMLRLTELSKEDEPPQMGIRIGLTNI